MDIQNYTNTSNYVYNKYVETYVPPELNKEINFFVKCNKYAKRLTHLDNLNVIDNAVICYILGASGNQFNPMTIAKTAEEIPLIAEYIKKGYEPISSRYGDGIDKMPQGTGIGEFLNLNINVQYFTSEEELKEAIMYYFYIPGDETAPPK